MAVTRATRDTFRKCSVQLNRWYANRRYADIGEPFIDDDWDVLIILDACRPEILYDCALPDGTRSTRYSAGSESWEFMQANFEGRTLHDTVYVTSNPHAYKLSSGIFYHVRNMLEEAWDDETGTVLPSDVTDAVAEVAERFPDKRLIAHYMQPHFPFVGERGRELDDSAIPTESPGPDRPGGPAPWTRLKSPDYDIDRDDVLEAYRENHELVAAELFELLDAVTGKVVVTADHTNLIGDRGRPVPIRMYGHPEGFPHPALRRVPWFEIRNGPRPEIEADDPLETEPDRDAEDKIVRERLEDLGYA